MQKSTFVYVTYIRTTQENLWTTLFEPESTRKFFMGTSQDCTWEKGATWRLLFADGRVADSGAVLEIEPQRRLVLSWRNEFKPELHEEQPSRMTYELEPEGKNVKLTITHESEVPQSKLIAAVSQGWPWILSSLKSLIETGEALEESED